MWKLKLFLSLTNLLYKKERLMADWDFQTKPFIIIYLFSHLGYLFVCESRFNLITSLETVIHRPFIHTLFPSLYVTLLLVREKSFLSVPPKVTYLTNLIYHIKASNYHMWFLSGHPECSGQNSGHPDTTTKLGTPGHNHEHTRKVSGWGGCLKK